MRLSVVTICDRYDDFLSETLPMNLRALRPDQIVIVTSPEDLATQRVCDFYDVDVLLTDALESRWGQFAKAKGINAGIQHLIGSADPFEGWILHLDADCALPPRTRSLLDHADLDRSMLYGVDRLCVPNEDAWRQHQALPALQQDGYHVRLDAFPTMPRFNAWHLGGYAPVGYFQLWHPQGSGISHYPDEHTEADRTDVLFAGQWPRAKRALLPEIAAYHLESEPATQGTNWGGRQTARFGHEPDPDRPPHRPKHRPHRHHHHRPDPDPYCGRRDER